MVREFFRSRTGAKKISDHIFIPHTHQLFGTKILRGIRGPKPTIFLFCKMETERPKDLNPTSRVSGYGCNGMHR
ncbi:DUF1661 domain-containing protein [Porphyromonas gulae]|uniref:DUF1661 domain-containing protein n=1 Tax=Porphyromonas gulae TaxID=111105 RepID=UPI001F2D8509|nr:DUF1661 domain-containing protein [Porphyromonas gulae]